jgi:hypothetical protein
MAILFYQKSGVKNDVVQEKSRSQRHSIFRANLSVVKILIISQYYDKKLLVNKFISKIYSNGNVFIYLILCMIK